jgi:hypothetical protein
VVCFSYNQNGITNWREWNFRMISQRQMGVLIAGGDVEPITREVDDGSVQLVGYKATKPIRRSDSSPTCLNVATMGVAAMGTGDTMFRGDLAQLDKFRLWPEIGDDRAVCVRPRPTAVEAGYLAQLLASGRLRPLPKAAASA